MNITIDWTKEKFICLCVCVCVWLGMELKAIAGEFESTFGSKIVLLAFQSKETETCGDLTFLCGICE